ncbi:MAG: DUF4097 family beta strand repeat-containing protein [bacterium]
MKNDKATKIIKMTFLFFLAMSITAFADNKSEKVLDEQSFPVNPNAELAIDHEFGNLECTNWEKNEIAVKIVARVDSDDPDKVARAAEQIIYEIAGNRDRVSVRCRLNKKGKSTPNVSVDVIIMMPEEVRLDIKHKFGHGFIETARGISKVESEYGVMKIQALHSPESKVKIEFGEGHITHMAGGDLSVEYSSLWLGSTGDMTIGMSYSDGEVDKADKLYIRQEGGELEVSSANSITGSSGFGSLKIGTLADLLDMKSEYGNLTVRNVSSDFSSIKLKNSFGSSKLMIDEAATYQLDAEAESGSIDFPASLANITYRDKNMSQTKIKGTVGRATSTSSTVTIQSEYGSVNLLAIN